MHSNPVITSSHNPFFRNCLQLRDNRKRKRSKLFLIDGTMEITHAIAAGLKIQSLIVSEKGCLDESLLQLCDLQSIPIQPLAKNLLEKLSYGQWDEQPIAVAEQPELLLQSLQLDSTSLVLVLDRTEKPGNLGACMRSAAACGVDCVVLTDPICDPFNANAIRASRGTMFRVPLAIATRHQFVDAAGGAGLPIYAARVDAQVTLWDLPLDQGAAIVFGNEAEGLSDEWRGGSGKDFTIPMSSRADSLNLSISAAVTLYEAHRQRLAKQI
ncbi:MAG: RNA methyltransferase [Pirellulales bacterium]